MKRAIFLPILFLILLPFMGCDWQSLDAKVEAVRTAAPYVHTGEVAAYAACQLWHASGTMPEKIWPIIYEANKKYLALYNRLPAAFAEWDLVKGKPAGGVILQLLADMNKIIQEINAFLLEWKAPAAQIRNDYKPILDSVPTWIKESCLKI